MNQERIKTAFFAVLVACCFVVVPDAGDSKVLSTPNSSISRVPESAVSLRIMSDMKSVKRYRRGLSAVMKFTAGRKYIYTHNKVDKKLMLTRGQKEELWNIWQRYLDYYLALDSIRLFHSRFYLLRSRKFRRQSFMCYYYAFLTQYRFALDFLKAMDTDSSLDVILNEPVTEIGLGRNSCKQFRLRYLSVAIASEFVAMNSVFSVYRKSSGMSRAIINEMGNDIGYIYKTGVAKGIAMTYKNGLNSIRDFGLTTIFPIQAGVSEWMGDTKVWRVSRSLITEKQINALKPLLEPGDIILERREWYLSNIGLPGFWPHAALYIGTAAEREEYFRGNDDVAAWVKNRGEKSGRFEGLLKRRYPVLYRKYLQFRDHGHRAVIIEAVSEGVSFSTLEHSASADSLAVLRPRLPKRDIARAIVQAFHYHGRPYDFDFNFLTDSTLVCTELIYKCYEPSKYFKGLKFKLKVMMGRIVLPANEIVRQFDDSFNRKGQQMDLVIFYDGYEKKRKAVRSSVKEFKKSWKRPKWHVFVR